MVIKSGILYVVYGARYLVYCIPDAGVGSRVDANANHYHLRIRMIIILIWGTPLVNANANRYHSRPRRCCCC